MPGPRGGFAIGTVIGDWTVIGELERQPFRSVQPWAQRCRCRCGTERVLTLGALRSGKSRSCGCGRGQRISLHRAIHGGSRTEEHGGRDRLYGIWRSMIARCENPRVKNYHRYGGRGIGVCEAWRRSYAAFRQWALSHGYADGLSIERIDGDRGYEPANCCWATPVMQASNLRSNRRLQAFGEERTLAEWSRDARCAVHPRTFGTRIAAGWGTEEALQTPALKPHGRRHLS